MKNQRSFTLDRHLYKEHIIGLTSGHQKMAHFMCRKHGQHFLMALFRVPHQDYGMLYLKQ